MKTSEVFAWARRNLWVGKWGRCPGNRREYICLLLKYGDDSDDMPSQKDRHRAMEIVHQRLDYKDQSLETWLSIRGIPRSKFKVGTRMQEYRLEWLRRLEQEFASQGD